MKHIYPLILLLAACGKAGTVPASAPAQSISSSPITITDSDGKPVTETRETLGPDFDEAMAEAPGLTEASALVSPTLLTARTSRYELPAFEESWGLSRAVYDRAVIAMSGEHSFSNQRFVALIDMSHHSSTRRFFLFDLKKGKLERHNVAHGSGSDPRATGFARLFADKQDSEKTSLGAYKTAGIYHGKHGLQLRLEGLEASNKHALARGIVLHGASYVQDGKRAGRSWGCPAVDQSVVANVIARVKGGALLLIWK